MRRAKDPLDGEVTGIGIMPVLAAAQTPSPLQLSEQVAMAIYPVLHISSNNVTAGLRPIDLIPTGML